MVYLDNTDRSNRCFHRHLVIAVYIYTYSGSPSVVEEDDCVVVSSGVSEVALQTKSGHTESSTVGAQEL